MTYAEFEQAVNDARATIQRGDDAAQRLARMLVGRLQNAGVSHYVLKDLKTELANYNTRTHKWKEKKQ